MMKKGRIWKRSLIVNIFLICACVSLTHGYYVEDHLSCLSGERNKRCQNKRIKILDSFFVCNGTIELEEAPHSVRIYESDILVTLGRSTYIIDQNTMMFKKKMKVIKPNEVFYDLEKNKYFVKNNQVLMMVKGGQQHIVPIMAGHNSTTKKLGFDISTNILYIVSLNELNSRSGDLYVVKTNQADARLEKLNASKINEVKSVSDLAFGEDAGILVLGIKTGRGGKVLKLKRQSSDPCYEDEKKIPAKANLDNSVRTVTPVRNRLLDRDVVDYLKMENARVRRDLEIFKLKFVVLRSKLVSFKDEFSSKNVPSWCGSGICGMIDKVNDLSDAVCLPTNVYKELIDHIESRKYQMFNTNSKLNYYGYVFRRFVSDCEDFLRV